MSVTNWLFILPVCLFVWRRCFAHVKVNARVRIFWKLRSDDDGLAAQNVRPLSLSESSEWWTWLSLLHLSHSQVPNKQTDCLYDFMDFHTWAFALGCQLISMLISLPCGVKCFLLIIDNWEDDGLHITLQSDQPGITKGIPYPLFFIASARQVFLLCIFVLPECKFWSRLVKLSNKRNMLRFKCFNIVKRRLITVVMIILSLHTSCDHIFYK